MKFSVIIPVHNESDCVESLMDEFIAKLPADFVREIILAENGSSDNTLERCRKLEMRYPGLLRCLSLGRPSYGEAVKTGIRNASGDYISVLELDYLLPEFLESCDRVFRESEVRFVVASKRHPGSIDNRPRKRRLFTLGINLILNLLVGYPGSDTHGLKSIETGLAKKLCGLTQTTDEVFQTELVLLAWRLGHRIREVPVVLSERRPSPISVARRLPVVFNLVSQLRRSLNRFPPRGSKSTIESS